MTRNGFCYYGQISRLNKLSRTEVFARPKAGKCSVLIAFKFLASFSENILVCTLKSHLNRVCVILADVSALDISSGTATNSINANYFPTSDWIGEIRPRSRYPYTFPYFLYPPNHKTLALATSHELYAQYNPNGTKMHFSRISNHSMHKFPQHFDNVSEFNVSRSDAHGERAQTPKQMRLEFIQIGEE